MTNFQFQTRLSGRASSTQDSSAAKISSHPRGIALVITLLMLSVITFLAVAFLVLTRSQRTSATVVIDAATARTMSEAALARAQSEIISRMQQGAPPPLGQPGDVLYYDFMESVNFVGTFPPGSGFNTNNVNYDEAATQAAQAGSQPAHDAIIAQNIANLYYDPRPPVFVQTNLSLPNNLDFRFWVDINRNGRFETNGYQPLVDATGQTNGNFAFLHGEPEWIGVLEYPQFPHSATNRFIGRYAYLVLPIGKTADLNYIHNYAKSLQGGALTAVLPPSGSVGVDQYSRDQGVGSWELNLAGLLLNLNTNIYPPSLAGYFFNTNNPGANSGNAFDDAYSFMRFRYQTQYGPNNPWSLSTYFGANAGILALPDSGIDEYANPNDTGINQPWPGGYATNGYSDILSDLFDPNKVSTNFINDMLFAGTKLDSYNRYTFQRLLGSLGTGSAPELQTYVYNDGITAFPGSLPLRPRIKVNINYDNSYEISNNLNTSPPILSPWSNNPAGALAFFTNAAESLVRSQEFPFTNINYFNGQPFLVTNYNHFGLTNMIVYSATNASIRYSENLHRMLQVAANIYDATRPNASPRPNLSGPTPSAFAPFPSVFRPLFATDRTNLFIIGYTNMSGGPSTARQLEQGFVDMPNTLSMSSNLLLNANVWGIPWVVGAVKGVPEFDRFASINQWFVERKLLFARYTNPDGSVVTNKGPQYTNQYYCMMLTNISGMDAWNTYSTNLFALNQFEVFASNYITVTINNNSAQYPFSETVGLTNYAPFAVMPSYWRRFSIASQTNSMLAFLQTNIISLPGNYFSEHYGPSMWPLGASNITDTTFLGTNYGSNAFQPLDRTQSMLPGYDWTLAITNHIVYCLMDSGTGEIYDFVNLGPFGTNMVFTNVVNPQGPSGTLPPNGVTGGNLNPWDPTMVGNGNTMNQGVLNQINNAGGNTPTSFFYAELHGTAPATNNEPYFGPPDNPPVANLSASQTWIVNDPLVHYTLGDLTPPTTNSSLVLTENDRYEPWPNPRTTYVVGVGGNFSSMTFKDPLMYGSDYWSFPTNQFPSVGWLGRVHRGTPWQTLFLKADPYGPTGQNPGWTNEWVNTMDTYPTGDYALIDLFTASPNDNAASGQVSINETNSAAWYAVLGGVTVPTAGVGLDQIDPTTTNIDYILNGPFGLNAARNNQPNNAFHHLGTILTSPLLSIYSPFLGTNAALLPDEAVEAIPQQVMGLLKVGYPQFVIYGFGQSLKPKDIYFGANNFNLCTNYQITGEYVTRMVCHVTGAPDASTAKIQVDSFNILPGN